MIAIIPEGGYIPSSEELENDNTSSKSILKENNTVLDGMIDVNGTVTESEDIWKEGIVNINDLNFVAVCLDGRILRNGIGTTNTGKNVIEYTGIGDLQQMLGKLNCSLQDTVTLTLEKYILGSNNYFVYAAPKRLVYDANGNCLIKFIMPDINDPELIAHGKDDHTTPVYTNGLWDEQNCLIKMKKCEMVRLGEFYYTNQYGYTELYIAWRSNGFFTRCYDDYEFEIKVININESDETFKDVIDITKEPIEELPEEEIPTEEPTEEEQITE